MQRKFQTVFEDGLNHGFVVGDAEIEAIGEFNGMGRYAFTVIGPVCKIAVGNI
jgi:hypothetical protein